MLEMTFRELCAIGILLRLFRYDLAVATTRESCRLSQ